MELAKNDQLIAKLKALAQKKEEDLINYYKELRKTREMNEVYECLTDEYREYYQYIVKTKQEQYKALKDISDYLNNLVKKTKLTKAKLSDLKYDQSLILDVMDKVKNDLEDLTQ